MRSFRAVSLLVVPLMFPAGCDLPGWDDEEGQTIRVSVSSAGEEANDRCWDAAISGDGRFVAFASSATNLVPDDTNDCADVFVHDCRTGRTVRVSVGPAGQEANDVSAAEQGWPRKSVALSADGRWVAFVSAATNLVTCDSNCPGGIFVRDRLTGETKRVAGGYQPALSADGRFVAFISRATDLVPDDTNDYQDVFVYDRETGETERVNVGPSGEQANGTSYDVALSADGRFVAFESPASDLVPCDTNGYCDVFVHDRETGETERASVDSSGEEGRFWSCTPSISGDGRVVAFESAAWQMTPSSSLLTNVFVRDLDSCETALLRCSPAWPVHGRRPSLSADGRFVAFDASAIYVADWAAGTKVCVSSGPSGNPYSGRSPSISADGRRVAFTDLVPDDANGVGDIFATRNPLAP